MPWVDDPWIDTRVNKYFRGVYADLENAAFIITQQNELIKDLAERLAALEKRVELPIFTVD